MAWPDENQRAHVAPWRFWPGGLALALCTLAGCSPVSRGSLQSIRLAVHGERVDPTAESVASSPYYQLQVNTPGGEAILILAKTEQGRLGWYGTGDDIVVTRDGLIVKTVGLPQNLDDSAFTQRDPFHEGLQHVTAPIDYPRRMDWSPGYRYGYVLQAHLVPGATEDIDILGTVRRLRRIDERLSGPGVDLTNRYWIDPVDGFIWKSRQYVAPGYPVETIQLRPYREKAP
ncbi:YjbF family lipoprotein [Luteibacter sp. CQ10]|uniref:YjbF family lipoprotein n=1 Tax=Luteibacter sp. CQ10 TaxID=2805821 RepID=UPI0034A3BFDD